MISTTHLDQSKKYQYHLLRRWDTSKPSIVFIGQSPEPLDSGEEDTEAIKRLIKFAKEAGYGEIWVTHVFAYIAKDREELKEAKDPVGNLNTSYIRNILSLAEPKTVVCCWGGPVESDLAKHMISVIKRILRVSLKEDQLTCFGLDIGKNPVNYRNITKRDNLELERYKL